MARTKERNSRSLGAKVVLLIIFVLLFTVFSNAQTGEVTTVTPSQIFHQKGGDPVTGDGGFPLVASTVFDSLVSVTPEQKYIPGLAKSWKVSPDWKYVDFNLRDDVTFHNGDPFTAEDVKFSLESHMRRDLRFWLRRLYVKNIKDIEIINPYQIRLHLNEPWPWMFTNFWYHTAMIPKKYREKVGDDQFAEKPVGTGPFTWESYKQDVFFKLRAVKQHFRKTPEIETLTVRFVPDGSTRMAMLKAGEADIVEIDRTNIPMVTSDPKLKLYLNKYSQGFGLWYCDLVFPDEPSPFHDIRVRQAASMAIDREMLCKKVFFGGAEPIRDYVSPMTLGYDPNAPADTYDPEKAKELLTAAGYAKGFKTTLHTLQTGRIWAEAVASLFKDVGIDVGIEVYELGTLLNKFRAKELKGLAFPGIIWWNPDPHPSKDGSNFWTRGQTWCYNSTPEIEAAVQKALHAFSEKEIAQCGREMADRMRESRIMLPLWTVHTPYGLDQRIKKWEPVMGVPLGTRYEYLEINP